MASGGAARVSRPEGNSRNGFTTVERERPVAGSMSSSGGEGTTTMLLVVGAGSAENAGGIAAKKRRKSAVERDIAAGLYVVATPIGNLGDVTLRALEILKAVDVIAAEDTRVTRGLLAHFGISKKLVSLREHNEAKASDRLVAAIGAGQAIAFVTDAGTPGVSDPGATLVDRVRTAGLPVIPVPGASALTAALSASGLAFEGVVFAGFLPAKGAERRERLASLAAGPWAIVLFESPHRIAATLSDLHEALGERDVVIARELTKRFETIARVPLREAASWVGEDADRERGEFVLVIEAREVESQGALDPVPALEALLAELPLKQAVALAAKITGGKRNELYALALTMKK
jgi:16S rRNA (cytidine1402-2'-O)-methyltransferase